MSCMKKHFIHSFNHFYLILFKAVVCNELLLPIDLGEDEVVHLLPESIDMLGDSLSKVRLVTIMCEYIYVSLTARTP